MSAVTLFESESHRNILLPEQDAGEGVQTNQHMIVHNGEVLLLDPGGTKLFPRVLEAVSKQQKGAKLKHLFLSHQDPDIVASLNGWLMSTDLTGWVSELWRRFIPHFGSDRLVFERVRGIPDAGMRLPLGGSEVIILPAHFLHSCGNFHLYDPVSKILYTGDVGVSLGQDHRVVTDFEAHIPLMQPFHARYMASNAAFRAWVKMVRTLDVQTVAPQHGSMIQGPEMVGKFLDWCDSLDVGIDAMPNLYTVPA